MQDKSAFKITPKTRTKLPRDFTHSASFNTLSATAIKTFLYIVARREFEGLKNVVTFNWRDLLDYMAEDEQRIIRGNDYTSFSTALSGLTSIKITHRRILKNGFGYREHYVVITGWGISEQTGKVEVKLNEQFDYALSLLGIEKKEFTLVELQQAAKLDNPRSLRMLVWCYEFLRLYSSEQRRVDIATLKRGLGMSKDPAYDDWWQVALKLRAYQRDINTHTNMHLELVTIKENRRVVAVQFDVTKKGGKALTKT